MSVLVYCESTGHHLTQIFSGFNLLEQQRVIRLKYAKDKTIKTGKWGRPVAKAIINGETKIVYDTYDGDGLFLEKLEWCDFYFKRSFNPSLILRSGLLDKVFPLGFNYLVYADHDKLFMNKLIWNLQGGISKEALKPFLRSSLFISALFNVSDGKFTSHVSNFEGAPLREAHPKIIFFTRLWDPAGRKDEEDRREMNKMRAGCIRSLRDRFGERFVGGLESTPEALALYPDLVASPKVTHKKNFMKSLKNAGICIATRGLQGSNGWKIAEYIAGAKAIVSEPLVYSVPGEFLEGKNYLGFNNPDECVEKVEQLLDDADLRYAMMQRNYDYYLNFLRPDVLIANTFKIALGNVPN